VVEYWPIGLKETERNEEKGDNDLPTANASKGNATLTGWEKEGCFLRKEAVQEVLMRSLPFTNLLGMLESTGESGDERSTPHSPGKDCTKWPVALSTEIKGESREPKVPPPKWRGEVCINVPKNRPEKITRKTVSRGKNG